ncbi:hypothetical protein FQZ97_971680 [compost metagenome]
MPPVHLGDADFGNRVVLRRNRRGLGRRQRRSHAAAAGRRAAQPDRDAPCLWRCGARAGQSRPHPPRAAAHRRGAGPGRPAALCRGRGGLHPRPRPGRCVAGGLGRGLRAGLCAGQTGDRRAPPRRPPAVAVPERRPARISLRGAAGVGRPQPADAGGRGGALHAARRNHRRRSRRGLRQVGQAARPGLPGRACTGSAGAAGRRTGVQVSAPAAAQR